MKKNNIPLSNIFKLYKDNVLNSMYNGLSPDQLNQWIKKETNNQYIIIERKFVLEAIEYIEYDRYSDGFIGHDFKERWNVKEIKKTI